MSDKEFENHYSNFPFGYPLNPKYPLNTKRRHKETWQVATEAERKRIAELARERASGHLSPHAYLLNDFADLLDKGGDA